MIITGGNRGLGYEAVKKLLKAGYHVILGKFPKTEFSERDGRLQKIHFWLDCAVILQMIRHLAFFS